MDCKGIPAPTLWDDENTERLKQYRLHLQFCSECRNRVLKEAPEKLLFDLKEDPLPDEFWLGFWDSVDRKNKQAHRDSDGGVFRIVRWVSVIIFGTLLALYGRNFPQAAPHKMVEISIKLLSARNSGDVSAITRRPASSSYDLLDETLVHATEGAKSISIVDEYRVTFVASLMAEDGRIGLKNFEMRKMRRGKGGKDSPPPLLSLNLNMRNAETVVLGTKQNNDSLLLILVGKVRK